MRRWRCPAVGFGNWVPPPLVCADRRGPGSFRGGRLGWQGARLSPGAPNTATATSPPPSCPTAAPRPPRPTGSACTSRPPAPGPRCRTPGSMTRTATAARSRTSSRRGGSCSSPGRTARPGARGQGARRGGRPPARRGADRPPRRRLLRPALHLAAPPPDRQRRRGPVRPDRFIAWRHPAGTSDPRGALAPRSATSSPGRSVGWPVRHGLGLFLRRPPSGPLAGVPHHPPARPYASPGTSPGRSGPLREQCG